MSPLTHLVIPIVMAAAIPFITTLSAKAGNFGARDNRATRAWQSRLEGWRQRATWAHQNAFETFPMFAVAAVVAHLGAPASPVAVGVAYAYPALRALYTAAFIADLGAVRSTLWFLSMGCVATLFAIALIG